MKNTETPRNPRKEQVRAAFDYLCLLILWAVAAYLIGTGAARIFGIR